MNPLKDDDLPNVDLKSQLERLGVIVQTHAEYTNAMVASLNEEISEVLASYLDEHSIVGGGVFGRGVCGFYVSIEDFFRASELLLLIRQQLLTKLEAMEPKPRAPIQVWIWEPSEAEPEQPSASECVCTVEASLRTMPPCKSIDPMQAKGV